MTVNKLVCIVLAGNCCQWISRLVETFPITLESVQFNSLIVEGVGLMQYMYTSDLCIKKHCFYCDYILVGSSQK